MNVRQYVLVNMQLVVWFQCSLSHNARCCALQIASKKGLHTRKGARLTSHWKKLGDSLTWLLQDCLRFLTCCEYGQWKGDWRCYKHLLPQCHIFWDKPMLLGWESYARVIHECWPVCACKCAACDLISKQLNP